MFDECQTSSNEKERTNVASSHNTIECQEERIAYEGLRKNKQLKKWEYVAREGKKMADRKDLCGKRCIDTSTVAACPKITDDEHKYLFDSYWRMNCDQRRTYIGSMVTSRIPNGNPQKLKKSCILKYNFCVNGVHLYEKKQKTVEV